MLHVPAGQADSAIARSISARNTIEYPCGIWRQDLERPSARTSTFMKKLNAVGRLSARFELAQCRAQVVVAVSVIAGDAVLDAIHLEAARRVQKIVAADVVRDDRQHRVAAVGPEYVADRESDLAVVVEQRPFDRRSRPSGENAIRSPV